MLDSSSKRAVICQKQISVEGNGHCCHRPSSNWETNHHSSSGSVATPWDFSLDLGFFDSILGSWFFSEGLGFFLGCLKRPWVFRGFLGFFHILPKNTLFKWL